MCPDGGLTFELYFIIKYCAASSQNVFNDPIIRWVTVSIFYKYNFFCHFKNKKKQFGTIIIKLAECCFTYPLSFNWWDKWDPTTVTLSVHYNRHHVAYSGVLLKCTCLIINCMFYFSNMAVKLSVLNNKGGFVIFVSCLLSNRGSLND